MNQLPGDNKACAWPIERLQFYFVISMGTSMTRASMSIQYEVQATWVVAWCMQEAGKSKPPVTSFSETLSDDWASLYAVIMCSKPTKPATRLPLLAALCVELITFDYKKRRLCCFNAITASFRLDTSKK